MYSHTFRFTSTTNNATAISSRQMLFAAGGVGTVANSTLTAINASVKLKEIKVWSPPPSQGSAVTCSVEFYMGNGSAFSGTNEYSDTSVSTAVPAFIHCKPPRGSLGSFWLQPGISDTQIFVITAPTGSIVDVVLSLVLTDDDVTPPSRLVTTAVLGNMYFLALDNSNAGAHAFVPTSLTTTF
jgi:hypothetical protein